MAPFGFVLAGALLLLAASACGPKDTAFDPSHFHLGGILRPPDIAPPRGGRFPHVSTGLYVQRASTTGGLCCWIGPHSSLWVVKRTASDTLVLNTYVPDEAAFRARAQSLTLTFAGFGQRIVTLGKKPGFRADRIPVPAALRNRKGDVEITVDSGFDYVPIPRGERYGVVIISVYFE